MVQRPAAPAAKLAPLLAALGACRLGLAVRLASGGRTPQAAGEAAEMPPVLAAMPGARRPPGDDGVGQLAPAATQLLLADYQVELPKAAGAARSEVVLHALRDPWWVGNQRIQLVTVETRPNRTELRGIRNIGLNRHWEGYVTKLQVMTEWLRKLGDEETQIIFVDGDDTIFGGCSQEQFLRDYRDVVKRSGGVEVVIGAERGCYECPAPWTCQTVPEVPEWAYRNWTLASGGTTIGASRLDPSGQMRFLNSGFITGPAGKLRALYQGSLQSMLAWEGRVPGDQYFVSKYALARPKDAVLDYASSLVTCGYSLNVTKLFELLPKGGLFNRVTGKHQCFFHANGHSSYGGIVGWQRGGPKPW